jgi:hypothetical protein
MKSRKTYDTWQIHVNYGYGDGWEHECTELSRSAARQCLKDYRDNCPMYAAKIVTKREKIVGNVLGTRV